MAASGRYAWPSLPPAGPLLLMPPPPPQEPMRGEGATALKVLTGHFLPIQIYKIRLFLTGRYPPGHLFICTARMKHTKRTS